MLLRFKSYMFFLLKSYLEEQKCFEFIICNHDICFYFTCALNIELEEQRSHKAVTVM